MNGPLSTPEQWRVLAKAHRETAAKWLAWDAPRMAQLYADEAAKAEAEAVKLEIEMSKQP